MIKDLFKGMIIGITGIIVGVCLFYSSRQIEVGTDVDYSCIEGVPVFKATYKTNIYGERIKLVNLENVLAEEEED